MSRYESEHALIGVIADDLTGANATGILLRRKGYRTASLTGLNWPEGGLVGYDSVSINTESRALPPREAYNRVSEAARLLVSHQGRPLAKRIDSTLRGNLGPELDAVLETLGPGSMAVVTGAFPASGRTTLHGYHYVGGVPLAETPVRSDPLCPVTESHVPTLLAAQTRLPIAELGIDQLRGGPTAVAEALRGWAGQGVRLVAADAETDEDIALLGQGMADSGLTLVAADPGPLTAAFIAAVAPRRRRRVLVIAGSVTPVSEGQLDRLEAELGARLVRVDAAALQAGGGEAEREVERVTQALAALPEDLDVVGVRTGEVLSLSGHQKAEAIAAGFAEVAARALQQVPDVAGLYTTGGDITLAVCRRLGAGAITLVDEVLPLAVSGRLLGGEQPGLPIVTKGGLVGDADAAVSCVRHILKEVATYA
ncbi:MAG: four-carbon acid sugar kinase family protein [Bacillota bacterium]